MYAELNFVLFWKPNSIWPVGKLYKIDACQKIIHGINNKRW